MWSLPQDDEAHEPAFKNSFHVGVFHQPELGVEHAQYWDADVWAESRRPESEYSPDHRWESLPHAKFRTIWLGELINKGNFSYIHRIIFLFGPRKSVNAVNTMAGHKFNLGKRSSFLAFGQLLPAILQLGLISFVSLLCSPLVAVIFSTNPQCLCLSLPNIRLQWKIIILWLSESLIHCSCQIKIILHHQSYSSFLPTF